MLYAEPTFGGISWRNCFGLAGLAFVLCWYISSGRRGRVPEVGDQTSSLNLMAFCGTKVGILDRSSFFGRGLGSILTLAGRRRESDDPFSAFPGMSTVGFTKCMSSCELGENGKRIKAYQVNR